MHGIISNHHDNKHGRIDRGRLRTKALIDDVRSRSPVPCLAAAKSVAADRRIAAPVQPTISLARQDKKWKKERTC